MLDESGITCSCDQTSSGGRHQAAESAKTLRLVFQGGPQPQLEGIPPFSPVIRAVTLVEGYIAIETMFREANL